MLDPFTYLAKKNDLSVADFLCLLPVYQQIIGAYGMIAKGAQLVSNAASRVFNEAKHSILSKNITDLSKIEGFRKSNNEDREEHIYKFTLNLLRFIPIVGTAVSGFRIMVLVGHHMNHAI